MTNRDDLKILFTDEEWETYTSTMYHHTGGAYKGKSFFMERGMVNKAKLSLWREAFVKLQDPTEYLFALLLCGNWEHYVGFKSSGAAFRKAIVEWHIELEVVMRSKALRVVVDKAKDDAKTAQWLIEGKHRQDNPRKSPGRPKKDKQEDKIKMDVWGSVDKEDYDNILGKVN